MDYKKKYLKYKLKYLTAKKLYGGRESEDNDSSEDDDENPNIYIRINKGEYNEEIIEDINIYDSIYHTIMKNYNILFPTHIINIAFANNTIDYEQTFDEIGIEKGARFDVNLRDDYDSEENKDHNRLIRIAVNRYKNPQLEEDSKKTYGPISYWNTSNVTNMQSLFEEASDFNEDISNWDTSSVETMRAMFFGAESFNQPLNSWNTSAVKDMSHMFANAESFNQPLNTWNTSSVETMSGMFKNAFDFNQPLDDWNTSAVKNMTGMFRYASSFNQPLNDWNTSSVEKMAYMFYHAYSFNQPLDDWNTSAVEQMSYMFMNAYSFNQPVSLNKWDISGVKYKIKMFNGANSFDINLLDWNLNDDELNEIYLII